MEHYESSTKFDRLFINEKLLMAINKIKLEQKQIVKVAIGIQSTVTPTTNGKDTLAKGI